MPRSTGACFLLPSVPICHLCGDRIAITSNPKQPLKRMLLPPCRERPALFHFNCKLLWVDRMIEQGWWTLEDRLVYICDCVQPLIMACHVLSCMWCTLSSVAVLHYRDGEKGAILSER